MSTTSTAADRDGATGHPCLMPRREFVAAAARIIELDHVAQRL